MDTKKNIPGFVHIEDRKELRAGGILDVGICDGRLVTARTGAGRLAVRGMGLTMQKLDSTTGEMVVTGQIDSVQYLGSEKKGGFWSRVLK